MRLILVGLILVQTAWAQAEIMDTTSSLRAGHISLGMEFQAGLEQHGSLLLNIHEGIGLAGGMDIVMRQGILMEKDGLYLGGGVKWNLVSRRRSRPGLAIWLGGHYLTGPELAGADFSVMVDFKAGRLTPYLALNIDLEFPNNKTRKYIGLVPGLRILSYRALAFFVEGGIALSGHSKPDFISVGLQIKI